jgi:hypothetical protein
MERFFASHPVEKANQNCVACEHFTSMSGRSTKLRWLEFNPCYEQYLFEIVQKTMKDFQIKLGELWL